MIPRRLFFIHLGGAPLPAWAEANVRGWAALLGPAWTVEVITESNRPPADFEDIYQALPGYGAKSDVDRINVLARNGGVYLDYDIAPFRTLEPLVQDGVEYSTSFTFQNQVETAFVAMAPGHPLALGFLSALPDRIAAYRGTHFQQDYVSLTVGAWDRYLDDYLAPDRRHRVQGFNQPILSRDVLLLPYQAFHLVTQTPDLDEARALARAYPHTLGLHEFRGTWKLNVV